MIESFAFVELDSRICKITDLTEPEWEFLWKTPSNSQIQELWEKSSVDICEILQNCYNVVSQLPEFQEYSLKKALSVLAKEKGINMKLFMHILRVSLSGLQVNNIFTHFEIHVWT